MAGPDIAKNTIQDVQRELAKNGDAKSAVTILLTEINNERNDTTLKPGEFDKYVTDVMTGLKQELPSLSVGWVANNITKPGFTKIDNNITDYDYGSPIVNLDMLSSIPVTGNNSPESQLATAFMQQASKIDGSNGDNNKDNQVSVSELTQFISDTQSQVANLPYAKMFATKAGQQLLKELDTAGDGIFSYGIFSNISKDGKFDKGNLGAFLNENSDANSSSILLALSDETGMKPEVVKATLQNMYDHWDDPQLKLMRGDGSAYMDLTSIANGAGFNSIADCAKAGECNVAQPIIPPTVAGDQINSVDSSKTAVKTDSATLEPNSKGQVVRIDYNKGMPTTIVRDTSGAPINISTGDGYTLAYDSVKGTWSESHFDTTTKQTTVIDITAPTVNNETGEIDYSYTGISAAKVQYRPDGARVSTDAAGVTQVQTTSDSGSSAGQTGLSFDTHKETFGEAAIELAKARFNLTDKQPTQKQIQSAKIEILIAGYIKNVLNGVKPADNDPFIAKLNSMKPGATDPDNGSYGISEYITAGGKRLSIYSMLKDTITY